MKTNLSNIVRAGSACPLLTAALALAITLTLGCEEKSNPKPAEAAASPPKEEASGTFKDDRDGKVYKWVKIGTQTWMAENLNYNAKDSDCNSNDANCIYGRLYLWATAMNIDEKYNGNQKWKGSDVKHRGICPSGWHIPNDAEWKTLVDFAGGEKVAGKKLKAKSGWNNSYEGKSGNGTDEYGFAAMPGSQCVCEGGYQPIGNDGYWWSASENDDGETAYMELRLFEAVARGFDGDCSSAFSVRCIKD